VSNLFEDIPTDVVPVSVWTPESAGNHPHAYLIVLNGSALVGRTFRVVGQMTIGRSHTAEIQLDDDSVSRHHARVEMQEGGKVVLTDLDSRNGTWCNGARVSQLVLNDGDKVQIGSTSILKFSYQDELEEALQQNLYEQATRDPLTRVHNRRYFQEALAKEFAHARRHKVPLSLLLLDIDHFKAINDGYGHLVGDHILQRVARRISDTLRIEDTLARYGGEEFVALLRETSEPQAVLCAERIRKCVQDTTFTYDGRSLPVTVSIGVATVDPQHMDAFTDLVQTADSRLYAAKEAGRNRVQSG
jgi:two-component system, cell cycle response regulator